MQNIPKKDYILKMTVLSGAIAIGILTFLAFMSWTTNKPGIHSPAQPEAMEQNSSVAPVTEVKMEQSSSAAPARPTMAIRAGATALNETFDDSSTDVVVTSVRKEYRLPAGSYDSDPLKTGEVYFVFSALLNRTAEGEAEGYPIHYQKYVRLTSAEGFSSLPSLMLVTRGTTNGPYIAVGESKQVDVYVRVLEKESSFTATFKNGNTLQDLR